MYVADLAASADMVSKDGKPLTKSKDGAPLEKGLTGQHWSNAVEKSMKSLIRKSMPEELRTELYPLIEDYLPQAFKKYSLRGIGNSGWICDFAIDKALCLDFSVLL